VVEDVSDSVLRTKGYCSHQPADGVVRLIGDCCSQHQEVLDATGFEVSRSDRLAAGNVVGVVGDEGHGDFDSLVSFVDAEEDGGVCCCHQALLEHSVDEGIGVDTPHRRFVAVGNPEEVGEDDVGRCCGDLKVRLSRDVEGGGEQLGDAESPILTDVGGDTEVPDEVGVDDVAEK